MQIVDLCTYKNNTYALSVVGSHVPTMHSLSMFGDKGTDQTWERNEDDRGVFAVQEGGQYLPLVITWKVTNIFRGVSFKPV